jgi:hypothetical protein
VASRCLGAVIAFGVFLDFEDTQFGLSPTT